MLLTKETLPDYLKTHYPAFCTGPLTVTTIGEEADDNPGLINLMFRVRNGASSIIVKQGHDRVITNDAYAIPPQRNRLEWDSLRMRAALLPDYVPQVYLQDVENNLFIMEDVSYLKPSRRILTGGGQIPHFGRQCGHFMAVNAFYTSEFYLDVHTFRALAAHFTNSHMREIMENWVFLLDSPYEPGQEGDPAMARAVWNDEVLWQEVHLLRHTFMTRSESLLHADIHPGNVFAETEGTRIKVLDMEYTFAGPFYYDMTYFLASLLTQYCSACFRPFAGEAARQSFKSYMLDTMLETVETFIAEFRQFWDADAKPLYRPCTAFRDRLLDGIMPDLVGFSMVPAISMSIAHIGLVEEFEAIACREDRLHAMDLCATLVRYILCNRQKYRGYGEVLRDIVRIEEIFRANLP